MNVQQNKGEIVIYQTEDGQASLEVNLVEDTGKKILIAKDTIKGEESEDWLDRIARYPERFRCEE